jgi:hypothetical protein
LGNRDTFQTRLASQNSYVLSLQKGYDDTRKEFSEKINQLIAYKKEVGQLKAQLDKKAATPCPRCDVMNVELDERQTQVYKFLDLLKKEERRGKTHLCGDNTCEGCKDKHMAEEKERSVNPHLCGEDTCRDCKDKHMAVVDALNVRITKTELDLANTQVQKTGEGEGEMTWGGSDDEDNDGDEEAEKPEEEDDKEAA